MEENKDSTEEIEPIILVLPTLNQRIELPKSVAAHVWDAVKRGVTNDPKEYVMQILERALAMHDEPIEESAPGEAAPKGAISDQYE